MAYSRKRHITRRKRKYRGGFRYGNRSKHTPTPGEILISSPLTRTRIRTRRNTKTRKQYLLF